MRFAYLIQAHQDGAQLRALVDRLCPPGAPDRAYVHVDASSPLWRAQGAAVLPLRPEVQVIARPVAVRWGHASQLAATRLLLRASLADGFDVAHLISAQDWPVAPRAAVAAQIAASPAGTCWIEAVPGEQSERMTRIRLDSRWLRPDPRQALAWYATRALRHASALVPPRGAGRWGPWCKGSSWWSLPADMCALVLSGLDRAFASGQLVGTLCADEHLIQTIAAHHRPDRLMPPRRHILWDEGISSPRILVADDWAGAQAAGAWFARKLDRARDPFFLEM
ncbi:MAG TPA: beta-1,6-N-acetylglucosaminyltransferase [Novosphingobium sp.]|nr:beta-1,6-N-acetylglucosaminyltransferase [Novosphingobium sp.]